MDKDKAAEIGRSLRVASENIPGIKDDTTNIQDQLLILMGAVADLYEVVIGGDEV